MSLDVFLALLGFSLVASMTPGPNTIMLLASGVNFGFRRTIPHMLGITLGIGILLMAAGLGLREVFEQFPWAQTVIKVLGGAYLLYLAWKIAVSGSLDARGSEEGAPMTFWGAVLFQWVNPKAWVMGVTAITVYTGNPDFITGVIIVSAVFVLVSIPAVSIWAGFGAALRDFLKDPKKLRFFNLTMAVLLVASLWPMIK